ncbi:MAG TPA: WecB/TagA/CpsF family glycosyltransferase [Candidatus Polarisedimenticolaceae bacterium]|nr:WecB/TagA/CpsF family glycosyltransferase [Candidatus Polarisedimenticolaceae bacterium]
MVKTNPVILGLSIDALTMREATKLITAHASGKQPARYVVKPYVEFFDRAYHDNQVKELLMGAWLRLPEGVSAQWAAAYLAGKPSLIRAVGLAIGIIVNPRIIRKPLTEKFGGTVFTWQLLESCVKQRLKVYLIGSPRGGDIKTTAQAIQNRLPKLEIAGTWPGQWGGMAGESLRKRLQTAPLEAKLLADLQERKPDIILVGMGFPLQEELIAKLTPQLSHGVLIGEGGTFDYDSFGGARAKAPRWMQRIGLEWLWRLLLEPARWRRQLAVPRFMGMVYRDSRKKTKTTSSQD